MSNRNTEVISASIPLPIATRFRRHVEAVRSQTPKRVTYSALVTKALEHELERERLRQQLLEALAALGGTQDDTN